MVIFPTGIFDGYTCGYGRGGAVLVLLLWLAVGFTCLIYTLVLFV